MSEYEGFEPGWYPSPWGKDDELGALHHITPEKTLSALRLVKQGRQIPLGHTIFLGMPGRANLHGPFYFWTSQRVYDHRPPLRQPATNKFGAALCRLELSDHLGTHLDSLNHISYDGKFYNGVDAFEATAPSGSLRLGVDTTPPILTRGVLIDGTDGSGSPMKKGEPISLDRTQRFLEMHHLTVQPGDAVLFHTGLSSLWFQTERFNEYYEASPGVGYDTARWLAEQKVALVGADAPSTEVTPAESPGARLPVHQLLITKHGVRLFDNLKLDELAQAGTYEFLFFASPLRIKGATASPIVPVAVL